MLRNPQPGRVRLLIRCNIGFAVIIFCGQKYQDGRNNPRAPQYPDMVPPDGTATDKGRQNFTEDHNSYFDVSICTMFSLISIHLYILDKITLLVHKESYAPLQSLPKFPPQQASSMLTLQRNFPS